MDKILSFCVVLFVVSFGNVEHVNAGAYVDLADVDPYHTIEFAFILPRRTRECFYQNIREGAKLSFSYKVVTASTSIAVNALSVLILGPNKEILHDAQYETELDLPALPIVDGGEYEFCFSNFMGRFLEKKVQVYIGIMNPWNNIRDSDAVVNSTANSTVVESYDILLNSTQNIFRSMFVMGHHMSFLRRLEAGDLAYMEENALYITRLSIFVSISLMVVAYTQTYAVKRLFRQSINTPTHKPRA